MNFYFLGSKFKTSLNRKMWLLETQTNKMKGKTVDRLEKNGMFQILNKEIIKNHLIKIKLNRIITQLKKKL